MLEYINSIDFLDEYKSDKLYELHKSSSSEINAELLSKFKRYNSFNEFFTYYTNIDINSVSKLLTEIYTNLTNISNEDYSNKFSSNTDKYISQISKFILIFNLVLKIQENLSSILLKSKQLLNNSIRYDITNIHLDKYLSEINNLYHNNISLIHEKNISRTSAKDNSISSIKSLREHLLSKNEKLNINHSYFFINKNDNDNEDSLLDLATPTFIKRDNEDSKSYCPKPHYKSSNLSISEMVFEPVIDEDIPVITHVSSSKNPIIRGNKEIKICTDLLLLIQKLYKSCLITAEEKIKLKKLIISKSKNIFNFYLNEYNINGNIRKYAECLKKFI